MTHHQLHRKVFIAAAFALPLIGSRAAAQSSPRLVNSILQQPIQPQAVTAFQLGKYLAARIPKLPVPRNAEEWTAEEDKLRAHILNDVAFHGWPREWIEAPPRFEDLGTIETGKGYRLRKLRYEIVPGFESTAILYEPEHASGKAPAILNVHGHDPVGKAAEYKQKRCINFAKRGIWALSLEWMGYGELQQAENAHDFGAHLDLVGANALGLFYLEMRRGIDYLASLPNVDPNRLGLTGLSGGGWQTIVLSALDPRVTVAVEDAGFGSLESNIARPIDTDEVEEDATDLTAGEDYTYLAAMRAPRPTLLIHNAEDTCCFRAALVKPYIYDQIKPFFRLFGKEDNFDWHENMDPGTHNYQLDNREAAYRFFTRHFDMRGDGHEIPSSPEIKTQEELAVGLPANNLTILGLAKKLAEGIQREPVPAGDAKAAWASEERTKLEGVLRYKPAIVKMAWRLANTKSKGLESISYRFDFSDGLSAAGVWVKAIENPPDIPATIVINDKGKKAAGNEVSDRVNRGEQVLALDLLFTGDMATENPAPATWALKIASVGDRPLGIEAGQLVAVAKWLRGVSGGHQLRLESTGIRSGVVALAASALEPEDFSEAVYRDAMRSLGYLLEAPVAYRDAPDLFCLDLYKDFDVDRLAEMAQPVKMSFHYAEMAAKKQTP